MAIRRNSTLKTHKGLKPISDKKREADKYWRVLVDFLIKERANHTCEIPNCSRRYWLFGHHIEFRSHGRVDTVGNILVVCPVCHDHSKYASGIPVSREEALELVKSLNEKHGIDGDLTGEKISEVE